MPGLAFRLQHVGEGHVVFPNTRQILFSLLSPVMKLYIIRIRGVQPFLGAAVARSH
jgi:hypothetical protein